MLLSTNIWAVSKVLETYWKTKYSKSSVELIF